MINRPDRVQVWAGQLAANDFPPVCAMTGQPAETWRKFRFATVPGWAYAFLALLCTGIGLVPVFILMAIVSRRASGYLPLTHVSRQKLLLATWLPFSLIPFALVLWVGAAIASAASGSASAASPVSAQPKDMLVYTTWVADPKVKNGPQPGYKPVITGLTGRDIVSARATTSSDGKWVIYIVFTKHGSDLMAGLTQASIAACPGDPNISRSATCAERHLGIWLGLNQADIDRWEDPYYVSIVSQDWVSTVATPDPRPKFLTNTLVLGAITGGSVEISGSFTRTEAQTLASNMTPPPSRNELASGIAATLLLVGFVAILAGLIGLLVGRAAYGPSAKVFDRQPNQSDRLVELRRVHPTFVIAVQQLQLARAAQPPADATGPLIEVN
jgi:hypothetical protein